MTYPLSADMILALQHGKDVFIKNQPHETKPQFLEPGMKLFLYQSGGEKRIRGEAVIRNIELLTPKEIYQRYHERLLISRSEFEDYLYGKQAKKILVLQLHRPKIYVKGFLPAKSVTMNGRYVYQSEVSRRKNLHKFWRA